MSASSGITVTLTSISCAPLPSTTPRKGVTSEKVPPPSKGDEFSVGELAVGRVEIDPAEFGAVNLFYILQTFKYYIFINPIAG